MVGYSFLDGSFIRNPMPVYPGANQPCRVLTPLPRVSQRDGRSCYPLDRHASPVARTWWRPFPGRGVASPETPAPDREPLTATIAEFMHVEPHPRRLALRALFQEIRPGAVLLEQSTCSHVQVPNYANANYFLVASLCRLNLQ